MIKEENTKRRERSKRRKWEEGTGKERIKETFQTNLMFFKTTSGDAYTQN